jgi:hypothetical protein
MVDPKGPWRSGLLALVELLLVAGAARAQDAGIAGVVKDTSGAVLPGVTVTAASPVLIEQQHLAITDAEGRYTITRLRPGVYSITFSLPGFAPVVRQGVSLTAGFAANVDAELRVGSLTESITVTGASPAIDVVNVRKQTVVTRDQLEALPTSTKSVGTLATITTGLTGLGDVGGSYQVEPGQDVVSGGGKFHGKSGTKVSYDGMGMENSSGNSSYQLNAATVEEMVMSTSGISADTNADGLVVNIIPKEGSNTFRVELTGLFSNHSLESNNLTDDLRARGLTSGNRTIKLFDESASVGGPIKRGRVWFFVAPRSWGLARGQAGVYWNKTQDVLLTPPGAERKVVLWTPWSDRPEDRLSGRLEWYDSILSRITWQATARNKFNITYDQYLLPGERRRQLHVPQRDADFDHAAGNAVSAAGAGESGHGNLRPGSVEGQEQADAQPRTTMGLLQRLRTAAARRIRRGYRRLLRRGVNRQPVARSADVRSSR